MMPVLAATLTEAWIFYPLAVVTVAGALMMILSRNTVFSAMSLVLTFFGLAGLYVLLAAELIAALQVIVYAGAIMVLVLFVVMLLNLGEDDLEGPRLSVGTTVGSLSALTLWCFLFLVFQGYREGLPLDLPEGFGTVAGVGKLLYTQFLLPFEAISVLLLAAMVGAVIVAKTKI